jgi:hypothetical protein
MKLQVTIESGTLAGRSFDLEHGFLTVGRGDTCSIRFDPLSERIASKQHAFIEAKADGFYITDNQSTNGTFLNGSPVTTARLNQGDKIQFGRNGVTAAIQIEGRSFAANVPQDIPQPESFRDLQVQQFNKLVTQQPASMQSSLANFGLGSVAVATEPSKTGKYVGIGVTLFAIAFLMLIVAVLMFLSVGPINAVIAAVIAFVPAVIYILPMIWLDRYDPEPLWLLGLAFAWGALVAVVVSFIINTLFGVAVGLRRARPRAPSCRRRYLRRGQRGSAF